MLLLMGSALTGIGVAYGVELGGGAVLVALAAIGAAVFLLGLLNATVRVVADTEYLKIQNRLRKRRIPISDVSAIQTELKHFPWGKSPYSNVWAGPKDLLVGVVALKSGERISCDAVVSLPDGHHMIDSLLDFGRPSPGPNTPAAAKTRMSALDRWVAIHVGP